MSKIYTNGIVTTAGFQYNADSPLDDRLVVETFEDLSSLTKYTGMVVYVKNEDEYYKYTNNDWNLFQTEGLDGVGITNAAINDSNELVLTFSNGYEKNVGAVVGPQGIQGEQGIQGIKGEKGEPFAIAKIFSSVEEMNNGFSTDGVSEGQFVLIESNVDDEDNAKLFVKGTESYTFLIDLSGAQGIQGPQGIQGIQGPKGEQGIQGPKGEDAVTAHGTEAYWLGRSDIFDPGAIIIYDVDAIHSSPRFKIGDGVTKINDLPFAGAESMLNVGKFATSFGKGSLMSQEELKLGTISLGKISPSVIFANGDIPVGSSTFPFKITDRVAGAAIDTWLDKFKNTPHNGMVLKIGNNLCPLYVSDETFSISGSIISGYSGTITFMNGYTTTEAITNGTHVEELYMGVALGDASVAANVRTLALGEASFTEGRMTRTTKNADAAHAEGYLSSAEGEAAHAEGISTIAYGNASHAQGNSTIAYGAHSSAAGNKTRASQPNQFVVGKFNENKTTTLFEVGNGTGEDGTTDSDGNPYSRSNAFEVYHDGHAELQTQGKTNKSVTTKEFVDKEIQTVTDLVSDEVKNINNSIAATNAKVQDTDTKINQFNLKNGEGYISLKQESATEASGGRAVALGLNSTASGYVSMATGSDTLAEGDYSFAEGLASKAIGTLSHAQGNSTEARGVNSSAFGNHTIAGYENQFVVGKFNNNKQENIFEVGNGKDGKNRSNAFEVRSDSSNNVSALVNGKTVALLDDISNFNNRISKLSNALTKSAQALSGAPFVIEMDGIKNERGINITSTVKDNYAYKENLLKNKDLKEIRYPDDSINADVFRVMKIGLKKDDLFDSHINYDLINFDESNFNNVNNTMLHAAYILFTVKENVDVSEYKYLTYTYSPDVGTTNYQSIDIPIGSLKPNHQYILIMGYCKYGDANTTYVDLTYKYLLDQTEAYHYDITDPKITSSFPQPNCIFAVHYGKLDSDVNDYLSASWIYEASIKNGSAVYSLEAGKDTSANYENQLVTGTFNDNKEDTLFEVGNGTNNDNRSNAFEVYNDGHAEVQNMGSTDNSVATKAYVDSVKTHILLEDSITGKIYKLSVADGKLIMEDTTEVAE